jgi:hypothetical protein
MVVLAVFGLAGGVAAQKSAPLTLVQTITLPATITGNLDHFGIDVPGHRLFLAADAAHAVLVIDLQSGTLVHTITGLGQPRAVLYRPDLGSLYIIDGETGEVKVYDGTSYRSVTSTRRSLVKSAVPLMPNADAIGYDPESKLLYVDSSGPDPKKKTSLFNMVDTSSGYKGTDMEIDGDALGAMALETEGPLIYVNNTAKHEVDVIDREKWAIVAKWPVTMGQDNVAMALDEGAHRLFVGCRNGQIVVFNTENGQEIKALPIDAGVDDLAFDSLSRRLYAACGGAKGAVDVYQEGEGDQFKSLGHVTTGPDARDGELAPDLHRYFVSVPAHATDPAKVLVFSIN